MWRFWNPSISMERLNIETSYLVSIFNITLLRELHWLKVPERIQFRLYVLTHRCLHSTAPPYLAEMVHRTADVASRRRLWSAATSTLVLPLTRRSTLGDCAFLVAASCTWRLSASVRDIQSLPAFRQKLKLTLFSDSFAS